MATHRKVLAKALKDAEYSHKSISAAMGWKSPGSAGHKLIGHTGWSDDELARMCALAGMTVVELAAASDDMPNFFRRPQSAEGAILLDRLPEKEFNAVLSLLRAL